MTNLSPPLPSLTSLHHPLLFLCDLSAGSKTRSGGESGSKDSDTAGRGGSEAGEGDGDGLRGGDPPAGGRDRRVEDSESGATGAEQ